MKSPRDMNFLIVEDMPNMRRSIRAMLQLIRYGKEYFEAQDGFEAWNFLENDDCTIDFIISDYKMPHMTGTELLHRVRSNPKYHNIPFLMITAETNMEVVAEAAEHDVDAYLTKPFVTATLEQKIKELLIQLENPDQLTLYLRQIYDYREKGDVDRAIAEAKKATNEFSESSRPYRELGRLYMEKGEQKKALQCFLKATETNRLDVASYHYLGELYFILGKTEKATESFAKAMNISPRHSERALHFANLLFKQRQHKEAEKVLKLVLRNNNHNTDLKEKIADTCKDKGLPELAVKTYREILKEDPERFYITTNLGIALQRKGDNHEAIRVLEKAVEFSGHNIELLLSLSQAYLNTGKYIRADKLANRVVSIDPTNTLAREILTKCC